MVRRANQMEEETLHIVTDKILEIFDDHKLNAQQASSIGLMLINLAVYNMCEFTEAEKDEFADKFAENVSNFVTNFLERL